ncbi:MAG: protein prkA [Clostridia bacterium]|nr:protein prkA [Clostridia bacterium]
MTFSDYLALVRQRPEVAQTSHRRLYRWLTKWGRAHLSSQLFGLETTLDRLVEGYFGAAARGMDVRHRILLLVGPPGSGKSTIAEWLKRGLEWYSRQEEGALFGLQGCPMHEEPLHLLSREERPFWEQELGITIEGRLCPRCQLRLEEEYQSQAERFPVEPVEISEAKRVGIGTFVPGDPKSQDLADLLGSVNFATVGQYGSESDPRAYCFDGELSAANRGIMEFHELLKCDERFLYPLLSLVQEGQFKAGRFALISADEVVIGHTNPAEYVAFVRNPRNQALASRMFVVPVPYALSPETEVKIYRKLLGGVHLSPLALEGAAAWAVLTRLDDGQREATELLQRLHPHLAADGRAGANAAFTPGAWPAGMSGVGPRWVVDVLASAYQSSCLAWQALRGNLEQAILAWWEKSEEEKKRLVYLLDLAQEYIQERTLQVVGTALAAAGLGEGVRATSGQDSYPGPGLGIGPGIDPVRALAYQALGQGWLCPGASGGEERWNQVKRYLWSRCDFCEVCAEEFRRLFYGLPETDLTYGQAYDQMG